MTEPKRSLHTKLAQVMYEAERIPKNGKAPREMGGYPFVQVGDAADFIRKALAEKVVTMMPTHIAVIGQVDRPTKSGGSMTTLDLVVDWTITDGESGETIVIQSFGAGADGGDKYSGKAMTSAMKYAFLSGFLLSTGDDTEADRTPEMGRPEPARLPPREDPNTVDPEPEGKVQYTETEELVGRASRRGMIRKGTSEQYKLDVRQGPDGPVVGFKLEVGPEKNIPQCVLSGKMAASLVAAYPDPKVLAGTAATVAGILYYVRSSRGSSWYRLHVDRFENEDWIFPPDPSKEPGTFIGGGEPLFSEEEQARIDAELEKVPG